MRTVGTVGAALVLASCSGGSGGSGAAANSSTNASAAAMSSPAATEAPPPPPQAGVDLTFSGPRAAQVSGSTGYISAVTSADGAWLGCSIFLSGADYPELASSAQEGFSLDVGLGDQWNAKWVDGQKWFYTGMGPMSSTLDPDTKTVTLGSLEMQMAVDDPKETVSGTITCP